MNAYFFHTAEQPLFGIYLPPRGRTDRGEGILLCPPIAHEYTRTHWALRQLGDHLAQAGFHVFRFDYSGLGDSWGDFTQGSVEQWRADVRTALTELEDNAGVKKINVLGLRLGATLACEVARQHPLHRLVMWDPIVSGRGYVDSVREMQRERGRLWSEASTPNCGANFEDLLGFRYGRERVAELAALDAMNSSPLRTQDVTLVLSANRPVYEVLAKHVRDQGTDVKQIVCEDAGDWDRVDLFAEPLLIGPLQRALVNACTGGSE
jgi:pimeloyl-ACP methyl ester carboxylesterase